MITIREKINIDKFSRNIRGFSDIVHYLKPLIYSIDELQLIFFLNTTTFI